MDNNVRVIGIVGNTLHTWIEGARVMITSYISDDNKSDLIEYGEVAEYKSRHDLEVDNFGYSQY